MSQWLSASCSYDTRYIHARVHVMYISVYNVDVFTVFCMLHVRPKYTEGLYSQTMVECTTHRPNAQMYHDRTKRK